MANPKWKIYYADGSTFSAADGDWQDAPARGIIAVNVLSDEVGREVQLGKDYYVWWPDASYPWSVDKTGLWDFLYEVKSPLAGKPLGNEHFDDLIQLGVKYGRSMDTPDYKEYMHEVLDDPEFPPKSAQTPMEQLD